MGEQSLEVDPFLVNRNQVIRVSDAHCVLGDQRVPLLANGGAKGGRGAAHGLIWRPTPVQ